MCQHEATDHQDSDTHQHDNEVPRLRRRDLLKSAALALPASGALGRAMSPPAAAAAAFGVEGTYSMAMHIHSSFSEGYGSMDGHLSEATRNGVDVLWWTDHDVNVGGYNAKNAVHFTSLTAEVGDGPAWQWTQARTGSLTSASGGGIVSDPASPNDPVSSGSLRVFAQGTGTGTASVAFFPAFVASQATWRTNLTGQVVTVEVLPKTLGPGSYLELRIVSSHHPAGGGRSAGQYTLAYRLRPRVAASRRSSDRLGIVTVPCTPGQWNTIELRPDADLAALFPDLDARDFNSHALRLLAVSVSGGAAEGFFDYLRFTRPNAGEVGLTVQADLMARYAATYPGVAQRPGVELSHWRPHINWYGGNVGLPPYTGVTTGNYFDYVRQTMVPDIHAAGGLASYNHPYGVSTAPLLPAATQDELLRQTALRLLPVQACGVDILEVGYPSRAGVDLAHHVALWDVLSRNATFVTGNGVSDDHAGTNWRASKLESWLTSVWAPDVGEPALLGALRAGRAWCASLSGYRGALDLMVDGVCPMGSASISELTSRSLDVTATDLPLGAQVEVVQGAVDYAGTADPRPTSRVVATIATEDLVGGQGRVQLDTASSSFVRTQVRNSAGAIMALSNPVWLLREPPARGIPTSRAA